jgi:hypothetical protein
VLSTEETRCPVLLFAYCIQSLPVVSGLLEDQPRVDRGGH